MTTFVSQTGCVRARQAWITYRKVDIAQPKRGAWIPQNASGVVATLSISCVIPLRSAIFPKNDNLDPETRSTQRTRRATWATTGGTRAHRHRETDHVRSPSTCGRTQKSRPGQGSIHIHESQHMMPPCETEPEEGMPTPELREPGERHWA